MSDNTEPVCRHMVDWIKTDPTIGSEFKRILLAQLRLINEDASGSDAVRETNTEHTAPSHPTFHLHIRFKPNSAGSQDGTGFVIAQCIECCGCPDAVASRGSFRDPDVEKAYRDLLNVSQAGSGDVSIEAKRQEIVAELENLGLVSFLHHGFGSHNPLTVEDVIALCRNERLLQEGRASLERLFGRTFGGALTAFDANSFFDLDRLVTVIMFVAELCVADETGAIRGLSFVKPPESDE